MKFKAYYKDSSLPTSKRIGDVCDVKWRYMYTTHLRHRSIDTLCVCVEGIVSPYMDSVLLCTHDNVVDLIYMAIMYNVYDCSILIIRNPHSIVCIYLHIHVPIVLL